MASGNGSPGARKGNVVVDRPAHPLPLEILKPEVRAHHVQVAVAVQIAHANTGMDRRSDIVALPELTRFGRQAIPAQIVLIGHRQDVLTSIAVQIGHHDIVHGSQLFTEGNAFKQLAARLARVAVPGASGDEIDPAVAINVKHRAADLGRRLLTQRVPDPSVGSLHPIPDNLTATAPRDVVRPTISIQVRDCRLTPLGAG